MQSVMQGHCFLWDAEGSKQVDSTSLIGSILAKKVFFFSQEMDSFDCYRLELLGMCQSSSSNLDTKVAKIFKQCS